MNVTQFPRSRPSLWSIASCGTTHLFPQPQNLKPLKVTELPPLLDLAARLCPGAALILLVDTLLLPEFPEFAGAHSAREIRDDNWRQRKVGELNGLPGNGL